MVIFTGTLPKHIFSIVKVTICHLRRPL